MPTAPAFVERAPEAFERFLYCRLNFRDQYGRPAPGPIPDSLVRVAAAAACNELARVGQAPFWSDMDPARQRETHEFVDEILHLRTKFVPQTDLERLFRDALYRAANIEFYQLDYPKAGEQKAARATYADETVYQLQRVHPEGFRIGELAKRVYKLDAPAAPGSKNYTRMQATLRDLGKQGRIKRLRYGVWVAKTALPPAARAAAKRDMQAEREAELAAELHDLLEVGYEPVLVPMAESGTPIGPETDDS